LSYTAGIPSGITAAETAYMIIHKNIYTNFEQLARLANLVMTAVVKLTVISPAAKSVQVLSISCQKSTDSIHYYGPLKYDGKAGQ